MTIISELNDFSRRFAEQLFAKYPEWSVLAECDPEGFPAPGSLLVRIAAPARDRELVVRTYGNQVTIDFGDHFWHDHFLAIRPDDEPGVFAAALGMIDDLLSERRVVATRFLFGRPVISRLTDATRVRAPLFGHTEVISWTGALDRRF